ncbi:hypothetical protein GCM10027344_13060 [Spelaeicoccus albus]
MEAPSCSLVLPCELFSGAFVRFFGCVEESGDSWSGVVSDGCVVRGFDDGAGEYTGGLMPDLVGGMEGDGDGECGVGVSVGVTTTAGPRSGSSGITIVSANQ